MKAKVMPRAKKATVRKATSPYERIVLASKRGAGVRLSADEVFEMAGDDAISRLASNDAGWGDAAMEEADIRCLARGGGEGKKR